MNNVKNFKLEKFILKSLTGIDLVMMVNSRG
jgi:hypothetical protein